MDEFFANCPACGSKQRHTVLKFKEKDLAIVKCSICGCLHHAKPEKTESGVMLMVSQGGVVHKNLAKFDKRKVFKKGDLITHNDKRYEVRSVEDKSGGHSDRLAASETRNVYLVPYEKKLAISVHQPDGKTVSYKLEKPKDEEIKLGDVLKLEKKKIEVTRITSLSGEVKKAKAADILAITGKSL